MKIAKRMQMIEPSGTIAMAEKAREMQQAGRKILTDLYIRMNTGVDYRDYPPVSYEAFSEAPGNMGCMMAGHSLLYIDSRGNVEPCVFMPVKFGNIMDENISDILIRMKNAVPWPLHTTCPSILLSQEIKRKKQSGVSIPVPYEDIKEEFYSLTQ